MISDRARVHRLNSTARRISATAPPGSLLKRHHARQPRQMRATAATGRDAAHLDLIRQCPCLKCGDDPCGEAAHVRFASAAFGKRSGLGRKPDDSDAVPLCPGCHRLDRDAQHNRNEREFWDAIGINPLLVAQKLYAQRGDLVAMRAVVMVAISERSLSSSSLPAGVPVSAAASPALSPHAKPEDGGT